MVSEKEIFEIVDYDGRTTEGRTPEHGHPISEPCEPFSGMVVLRNESSTELWICGKRNAYGFVYHIAIYIEHPLHFWVKFTITLFLDLQ